MSYVYYNPNPKRDNGIDCVVRALAMATGRDWESAYLRVCMEGLARCDMPNSNHVWGAVLRREGFRRIGLPDNCPDCYTVNEFCGEHPSGRYVLATSGHVVTAVNGDYYDTWDSGGNIIDFYYFKEA